MLSPSFAPTFIVSLTRREKICDICAIFYLFLQVHHLIWNNQKFQTTNRVGLVDEYVFINLKIMVSNHMNCIFNKNNYDWEKIKNY